ncbi:MAG: hypothetical protein AB7F74_13205 [Parvibaculaceae bacterium]
MKDLATALAAAQVLAFRVPMLWAMTLSPTPARRAEAVRMIVEKQMAAAEGLNAAALAAFTEWSKVLAGQKPSAEAMSGRIIAAAAKPSRRRVKANAKRLRRRKRI